MTDALTPTEQEAILERIVRNQLTIKELEAENAALKDFFKADPALKPGTTIEVGKFYLRSSANTRIDNTLAQSKLTTTEKRHIMKSVVDPALARRYLTPEALAKITKTYDNRIEVGLL
jgi:hypothetical protein